MGRTQGRRRPVGLPHNPRILRDPSHDDSAYCGVRFIPIVEMVCFPSFYHHLLLAVVLERGDEPKEKKISLSAVRPLSPQALRPQLNSRQEVANALNCPR